MEEIYARQRTRLFKCGVLNEDRLKIRMVDKFRNEEILRRNIDKRYFCVGYT